MEIVIILIPAFVVAILIFFYGFGLGKIFEVYPVNFIVSILLIIFASIDLIPYFNKLNRQAPGFGKRFLVFIRV